MAELIEWTATEAVLREYADRATELYRQGLTDSGHIATGDLLNSVHCDVVINGNTLAVDMSLAQYWKYVEWDTRPHFPPHLPIFNWVVVKKLLPRNDRTGQVRTRGRLKGIPYTQEDMQHSLAWAVQHKIARDGTKGSHDLRDSVQTLNAEFDERIADAVAEDFGRQVDIVLRVFAR